MRKFERGAVAGRGRALLAAVAIRAGEEVLREAPAAVVHNSGSNVSDCTHMLAYILIAATTDRHRRPIAELVHLEPEMERKDPALMDELTRVATPAVVAIVAEAAGADAAAAVDAAAVKLAYCKHLLNSMTIINPVDHAEVGMAMYPVDGALLNHSNSPNCWITFDNDTLLVRSLCPVAAGEELTFSYIDMEQPLDCIRRQLLDQYFFDCSEVDVRPGARCVDEVTVAAVVANTLYADHVDDFDNRKKTAALEPDALVQAVSRAQLRAVEAYDWEAVLVASEHCLQLYRAVYRIIHPKVADKMRAAGLAALKQQAQDLPVAARYLTQAVRIFAVTHGSAHGVTTSTQALLQLVEQLQQQQPPREKLPLPETMAEAGAESSAAAEVNQAKVQGNKYYSARRYEQAHGCYDKAVALYEASGGAAVPPEEAAKLFSNRAAAAVKIGRLQEALADCEVALALDPEYGKARHRRVEVQRLLAAAGGGLQWVVDCNGKLHL
jgi:tetratricopeptide (TPR) repeat protein